MRAQGLLYLCLCLFGGPQLFAQATRSLQLIDIRSTSAACGYATARSGLPQAFETCHCTPSTPETLVDLL